MKIHYCGKYSLNPDDLPHKEHKKNAVAFKEAKDSKTMGIIASVISLVIFIPLAVIFFINYTGNFTGVGIGFVLVLPAMFVHELLHAVCFKEDAYMYTNIKQGMLFVTGPEDMSKSRFVFLSLFPNVALGLIPFVLFLLYGIDAAGTFGTIMLSCGAGDYYNVCNAVTQMPKGARTYIYKFNSYWYMP